MIKKSAVILLLNMVIFNSIAIASDKKNKDDQRDMDMEKAIFMASTVQDRVIKIGLVDCMLYALKNNADILIKRIEPKIKEDDIKIAYADFKPTLNLDYTLRDNTKKSTSSLLGAGNSNYRDINFNTDISGKLISGTEYTLEFLNQRYRSNAATQTVNPYYLTEPKITVTQPLFRDFGVLVNKADIFVAGNDKLQSEKSFENTVIDTVTKTKVAYYNFIYYLENHAIAGLSLERARDLLQINKARHEKGLLSSVDLLETEAAAAQREKTLLSAGSTVKKAEDDLKAVTNLIKDPEVWNAQIEIIDKPELAEEEVDLFKSLKNAFEYRPDYQSAKIDLKNRDIKIMAAHNALLPTVDLISSLGLNGLDKDYWRAAEQAGTNNHMDWSMGIKFSLPLGEEDRAKFDQRELEKAQALLSLKKLEQDIILDVRDKVRLAETQKRQVEVAKLSKEKENKNYQAQKERYAAGEISTHDMLDYQDALARAELDYIKAMIDYNIAFINLDKAQGLTLVRNDIKLEE